MLQFFIWPTVWIEPLHSATNQLTGHRRYYRIHLWYRLKSRILVNKIWNGTHTKLYLTTRTRTRRRNNMDELASRQVIRDWKLMGEERIPATFSNLKPSVRCHSCLYEIYLLESSASPCDTQSQAGEKRMTYFLTQFQRHSCVSCNITKVIQFL
jgi:hypothetical protein